MIYHLTVAGTPVCWSISALYDSAYGIAHAAAETWHAKQNASQLIIEIKDGKLARHDLFWVKEERQTNDDFPIHLNPFRGVEIDKTEVELVRQSLKQILIDIGYLIPRDEWERRYPASKLISDRFKEFNQACNALDRDSGEKLEFSEKWIPFMEVPEDFVAAYKVEPSGKGYGLAANRDGLQEPTDGYIWREITDAEAACRLLNSGWDWSETQVLLKPEPVEAA